MSDRAWDHFEREGGAGVHAWGATRAEAFAHAAEGMFALIVAPEHVAVVETREVRAQGGSRDALLVSWLNECLYVHEIEGFAVARVEVDTCRDDLVHGVLHGEPLDAARHRPGAIVKAATPRDLAIREDERGVDVRVVIETVIET